MMWKLDLAFPLLARWFSRSRAISPAPTPLIFISYATPELPLADALSAIVRRRVGDGVKVFVAARSILKGAESRHAMLHDALRSARIIVPICTARSLGSRWLWFETGAGFGGDKLILPLCVGIDAGQIPEPLGMFQATKPRDLSALLHRIKETLGLAFDCSVTEEEQASISEIEGAEVDLESSMDERIPDPVEFPDIYVEQSLGDPQAPRRAVEFFTVWVYSSAYSLPTGTIDPLQEDRLLALIRRLSPDDAGAVLEDRRATYVSFESKAQDLRVHRKWGFWSDGYLALSSTLRDRRSATSQPGQPGMYSAADLALDLTQFFLVAGHMGNRATPLTVRFLMYPYRLALSLSPSHPQVLIARLGGVDEPVPKQQAPENSRELELRLGVTLDELREAPEVLAAKLVTYALRHFHGARADEERVGVLNDNYIAPSVPRFARCFGPSRKLGANSA